MISLPLVQLIQSPVANVKEKQKKKKILHEVTCYGVYSSRFIFPYSELIFQTADYAS